MYVNYLSIEVGGEKDIDKSYLTSKYITSFEIECIKGTVMPINLALH